MNCGRIVTVISPEAGKWRAEITGTGRFWMEAQAQSDIYFVAVEFVKKGGRPGHEGLFRIQGQPLAGTRNPSGLSLRQRNQDHRVLSGYRTGPDHPEAADAAVNSDREFLEFVGSVDLPSVPFRVAVKGATRMAGNTRDFSRICFMRKAWKFLQSWTLTSCPREAPSKSRSRCETLASRAHSSDGNGRASIREQGGTERAGAGRGGVGTVRVDLTVPAGTAPGVGDDVVIVARSIAGPPTSNSSVCAFRFLPLALRRVLVEAVCWGSASWFRGTVHYRRRARQQAGDVIIPRLRAIRM